MGWGARGSEKGRFEGSEAERGETTIGSAREGGPHIALALLGLVKTVLVAIRKWGVLDVANDLARRSQRDSTQRQAVRIFRVEGPEAIRSGGHGNAQARNLCTKRVVVALGKTFKPVHGEGRDGHAGVFRIGGGGGRGAATAAIVPDVVERRAPHKRTGRHCLKGHRVLQSRSLPRNPAKKKKCKRCDVSRENPNTIGAS